MNYFRIVDAIDSRLWVAKWWDNGLDRINYIDANMLIGGIALCYSVRGPTC
jgi:hypothetical protein